MFYLRKYSSACLFVFFSLTVIDDLVSQDVELMLPVFELTADPSDLDKLYANPWTNEYFPAQFVFDSLTYDCEIRFRGSSSRTLPKKSWRIRFPNRDNIFGVKKLNLNAEFRDQTLMRNFLAMRLFNYFELPAPMTEFIKLELNDENMGVFVQVEDIDEDFLKRRGKDSDGDLYKAISHGASTAPLLRFSNYHSSWERKIGPEGDYDNLQRLLSQFRYWNHTEFEDSILTVIDVEQFLKFFAIQFAVASHDGFTKNQFLYTNPETAIYEIFPWDNDATFGNDYRGDYQASFEKTRDGALKYHLLFQRLMDYSQWREQFYHDLEDVTEQGFALVANMVDSVANVIRQDVYQDTEKSGSNEDFETGISRLKDFLANRAGFLHDFEPFARTPLTELFCSTPFPTTTAAKRSANGIVFRAKSAAPQGVFVEYAVGFDFGLPGDRFTRAQIPLFDDGLHQDGEAGDLVYGNELTLPPNHTGLLPFTFHGGEFSFPANGHFYIEYAPTHVFALNSSESRLADYQNLEFGKVYRVGNERVVELRNIGESALELSLCYFQSGSKINRFCLPPGAAIAPEESIFLTSNLALAKFFFDEAQAFGEIFFDVALGDTMKLLSPVYSPIISKELEAYEDITPQAKRIVITEINYNSASDFEAGDWVELYNPGDETIDFGDWKFQDQDDGHSFDFPENTLILPRGYFVVCADEEKFTTLFPDVENFVGELEFGLSGGGELLRLLDPFGVLVDSVRYGDQTPWPAAPDGGGPTLELLNIDEDNALAENWAASQATGGTPGARNSVDLTPIDFDGEILPEKFALLQNYPNPFNGATKITFKLGNDAQVQLKIYDVRGRLVDALLDEKKSAGRYTVTWETKSAGSGVFLIELIIDGDRRFARKAVYLK